MFANPMSDIKSMLELIPLDIAISSVRTKKICIQDILSKNNVDITSIIKPYEPPKMIDLIKSGLVAVTHDSMQKYTKEQEEELNKENILSNILHSQAINQLQYGVNNLPSHFSPPMIDVPVPTYSPYYNEQGGTMDYSYPTVLPYTMDTVSILESLRNSIYTNLSELKSYMQGQSNINRDIVEKEGNYVISAIDLLGKAMTKSIADYFRDMAISVLKNGCSYFPVGLSGALSIRVINNTPIPQMFAFENVVVKSMNYTLSKPSPFSIITSPMENNVTHIPILVENVDAVDYILQHKGKGAIPITMASKVKVGPLEQDITFYSGNVIVK